MTFDPQIREKHIQEVEEAVSFLKERLPSPPSVVLMLGTGLGEVAEALEDAEAIPYSTIPNFPVSTSPEHRGNLVCGTIDGVSCAVFQGRFHYYEGYSARELTLPVRVMALLGARVLVACNAAGGLNLDFNSGDLMLIRDHINLIPDNPLRGPNVDQWGERFPDMSDAYDPELRKMAGMVGRGLGITLAEGVFVAVPGPSLETPAETRYLRMIGADAVAMSLVPEVIVARHAGMRVLGISVIANVNDPDHFKPILIEDVIENAQKAQQRLARLLTGLLMEFGKNGV